MKLGDFGRMALLGAAIVLGFAADEMGEHSHRRADLTTPDAPVFQVLPAVVEIALPDATRGPTDV